MKRYIFCTLLLAFGQSLYAQEEYIRSFHSELTIDKSALLTVTETIEVYAGGNQIQRGLVRSLPLSGMDYRNRIVKSDYTVISVEKDGQSSPFNTEKKNGNFTIYIGEADVLLPPGWYTYKITYSAEGQLGYFEDYDEIYWNVNGNDWSFRIASISAEVQLPGEAQFDEFDCYTGFAGSTDQKCTSNLINPNTIVFEANNLESGQNLSISAGFTKGIISEPPPPSAWERFGLSIIAGFTFLILMTYYVITWKKYGIDPPKPTVIPEFNPPEDLSPASIGVIHKGNFWNGLISASIVNLAVRGHLQINEKTKEFLFGLIKSNSFHLTKMKEVDKSLSKEEVILMNNLFSSNTIAVIDGKFSSQMKSMFDSYAKSLTDEHKPLLTQGQNWKFLPFPIIVFVVFALIATTYDFDLYGIQERNIIPDDLPILPIVIFIVIFSTIMTFTKKKKNRSIGLFLPFVGIVIVIGAGYLFSANSLSLNSFVLMLFVIFAVISFFTYAYLIRKPSVEKLKLRAEIDGFKRYLSTVEERQLQMFNPPQLTPEVFEQLLPYAMVFKVDKIWGKKFQNLIEKGVLQNQQQTSWYTGTRAYSYHTLGNHINKSLTSSINTSSGRNSSGGSGSRGGGSSGGGRGGGGGGGW